MTSSQIYEHLLTLSFKYKIDPLTTGSLWGWYRAQILYDKRAKKQFNSSLIGFEMNFKKIVKEMKHG